MNTEPLKNKTEEVFVDVIGMTRMLGISWFGDLNAGAQKLRIRQVIKEKGIKVVAWCVDGIIIERIPLPPPVDTKIAEIDDFIKGMASAPPSSRMHEMMLRGYTDGTLIREIDGIEMCRLTGGVLHGTTLVHVDTVTQEIYMAGGDGLEVKKVCVYRKGKWAKIV